MASFKGVSDLHAAFVNLSEHRLRWAFQKKEMNSLAFALGTILPPHLVSERSMVTYLKNVVMEQEKAPDPRHCVCNIDPTKFRWTRFDNDTSRPVLVYIDPNMPSQFIEWIEDIVARSGDQAYNFKAVLVASADMAEVIVRYQEIDGEGGTLGMAVMYSNGSAEVDLGRQLEWIIDPADFPPTIDRDIFDTVGRHEFDHIKGCDHTPLDQPQGFNYLDAFYHGVFTYPQYGFWDLSENHSRYGQPIFA